MNVYCHTRFHRRADSTWSRQMQHKKDTIRRVVSNGNKGVPEETSKTQNEIISLFSSTVSVVWVMDGLVRLEPKLEQMQIQSVIEPVNIHERISRNNQVNFLIAQEISASDCCELRVVSCKSAMPSVE